MGDIWGKHPLKWLQKHKSSQLEGLQCRGSCKFCLAATDIVVTFIPFLSLPVRWMFDSYLITLETQVISPEAIRQKSLSEAGWFWSMKLLFLKGRHGFSSLLCQCKVKVLVTKSCLTLCVPKDCSPPGSSVHGCVASPFSRGSSWPRDQTPVSCIAGRFLTFWATREALCYYKSSYVCVKNKMEFYKKSQFWVFIPVVSIANF